MDFIQLSTSTGNVVYIAPNHVTAIESLGYARKIFLAGGATVQVEEKADRVKALVESNYTA